MMRMHIADDCESALEGSLVYERLSRIARVDRSQTRETPGT